MADGRALPVAWRTSHEEPRRRIAAANALVVSSVIEGGANGADPAFLAHLERQCAARTALFDPASERAAVNRLVDEALTLPVENGRWAAG